MQSILTQWVEGCRIMMGYHGFGGLFIGIIYLVLITLIVFWAIRAAVSRGNGEVEEEES